MLLNKNQLKQMLIIGEQSACRMRQKYKSYYKKYQQLPIEMLPLIKAIAQIKIAISKMEDH